MSEHRVTTKSELLADIEQAWTALNATLEQLSEAQMTSRHDDQGWTVKDHLIHLVAWERSVVFLLQGQPRSAGLGVEPTIYEHGSDDDINAIIFQQHYALPLSEAQVEFQAVHQQLLTLLQPLSDANLQRPTKAFLLNEDDDRPVINLIYGNTAHHFREHRSWIKTLVSEER
jgi:hypothetical protein